MDRQKGTFQRMLDDPKVAGDIFAPGFIDNEISSAFSLLEDSSQQLWIFSLHWPQSGTLGSIAKVDLRTNKMEIIRERAAIVPWQTIQCADGSIWIAGAGVGGKVHKIRPGNTQIKYLPFVMNDGGVNKGVSFEGLAAQNDSIVWGKTSSADGTPQIIGITNDFRVWGVRELPEVKKIDTSLIGFNKIMGLEGVGMVIDQRGLLWGCTGFHNGGLFSIAPNEAGVHQYLHDPNNPNSPLENDIRYLMTDRKGIIWLANRHSVSCFDPVNELFTHYKHDPNDSTSLSYTEVFTLFEDRDGYIWIGGMEFNGLPTLDRLDPSTGKIIRTEIPLNYQGGWINNISQSKQGDIYFLIKNKILAVIFYEQISRENVSETWHSFMDTTFQNANNLIADDQGIFWLTTNDGKILRLDPETQSLIEFQDRPGLEFKQRRSFKLPDGTIYFPYQEGLVAINPLDKVPDQLHFQPTKVRFTEFFLNGQSVAIKGQTIFDRPIWQTSQLNLSYQQSNFGLRFSAFDLKKPENSQYEVRLLPNETTWRRIEGEPVINYYQLPPGNYTLEVKGSDSYGIWAQEIASMNIHISPPWWKSWWAYMCYGLLMLFIIFRFDRFQRQRIVERERQRTLERELEQSKEIKKAYAELKATQSQLIQSEKMASLGELTAGIAHEIQNPLNFVNNFSEVNKELIAELKEEIEKGNLAEVKIIANDLTANEEKIHQHGKRADAIVKSMLQHSRTSTGEKELTDINALCDEYLRLAYHGMRARDKSFNADFKTKFDTNLPKIKVIPQDMGRVLLNLINNAFQAAADVEKPEVVVSTEKHEDRIEIKVKDNGPGIPEHIKDKIFQPFFTTKPTGQGTGLGLSLAYDIVKAHGGELIVTSSIGAGATFTVSLPAA
ncbi:MAG: ATP-binding protein [Saprospiraceae bacterium]